MKKFLTLLLVLSVLIIPSCRTTRTEENKSIQLPPKPQRQKLENPETLKDYALIIVYYEGLVQQWESWGNTVEGMINGTDSQYGN